MKNIIDVLYEVSSSSVKIAEKISHYTLIASKEIASGSLSLTGGLLHSLSWVFFFAEEWQEGLLKAKDNVDQSNEVVKEVLSKSIDNVQNAFEKSHESLELAKNYSINFIYDNRLISSILGSVHHDQFGISDIQMSFRKEGKDITADEVYEDFKKIRS